MGSPPYVDELNDVLKFCKAPNDALVSTRHQSMETMQASGQISFDALLSLIDSLSETDGLRAAVSADLELRDTPAFLRREIGNSRSLPTLFTTKGWPLVRSLTYVLTGANESGDSLSHQNVQQIEELCLLNGQLNKAFVRSLTESPFLNKLRSLELNSCTVVDPARAVFGGIVRSRRLEELFGARLQDIIESAYSSDLVSIDCKGDTESACLLIEYAPSCLRNLHVYSTGNDARAFLRDLIKAPELAKRLHRLSLSMDLDDSLLGELVECRFFVALEHLTLQMLNVTPRGFGTLASCQFAPQLKSLNLGQNNLGDEGWVHLSKMPLDNLTELDISGTSGGDLGATALSHSSHLANLRVLRAAWNRISDQGARDIATSDLVSNLLSLDIAENPIGDQGALALASTPGLASLRFLRAGNFSSLGASYFAKSSHLLNLEGLILNFDDESCKGTIDLSESEILHNLLQLHLGYCVGDSGVMALSKNTNFKRLRRLSLLGPITGKGMQSLANASSLAQLWELSLNSCPIGDEGAQVLSESSMSKLIDLQVFDSKLTKFGSAKLAKSESMKRLRWLSIDSGLLEPWKTASLSPVLRARLNAFTT
jgi:hypothetical protein